MSSPSDPYKQYGVEGDSVTLINLFSMHPKGVSELSLQKEFGHTFTRDALMDAINDLLAKNILSILGVGQEKGFFLNAPNEVPLLASLDQNARVVYLNVKLAADRGIAVKQLTARCSLHQKVVQDALKLLEKKGAVKAVKGVKNTIRRLYMLANLKPSAEITGGLWYSDQVLDQEFIEVLADVCHQYVAEHSIPPRAPPGTLYPSTYERYVTLGQIRRHVIESRVLNEIPTRADIRTILNRLCFDGKVERRRVGGGGVVGVSGLGVALGMGMSAGAVGDAAAADDDDEGEEWSDDEGGGSGKGEAFCYKATQQGMQRRKGVIERDAWTDVPCGRCPVFDECWEGGAVSPASCVYYKTWLGKVAKSGTASGVNGVNGANVQNMF